MDEPLPLTHPAHAPTLQQQIDQLYDQTSEAVRSRDPVTAAAAEAAWALLDELLRTGAPLPSPWQRRR